MLYVASNDTTNTLQHMYNLSKEDALSGIAAESVCRVDGFLPSANSNATSQYMLDWMGVFLCARRPILKLPITAKFTDYTQRSTISFMLSCFGGQIKIYNLSINITKGKFRKFCTGYCAFFNTIYSFHPTDLI